MSKQAHRFKKGTPVRLPRANPDGSLLLAHRFGWVESSEGTGAGETVTVRVQLWLRMRALVRLPASSLTPLDPTEAARFEYLVKARPDDGVHAEKFSKAVRKLEEAWRHMKYGGRAVECHLTGKKGTKVLSLWGAPDLDEWLHATFDTSLRDLSMGEANREILVSEYEDLVKANQRLVRLERRLVI